MALQTQVNFALLSEAQRIELCKQYGISPDDKNAEVKINDIFTEAAKNNGKDRLADLHTRYDASKIALENAKANKLKTGSLFSSLKSEYSSDPKNFNLVDAQRRFLEADKTYTAIDQTNTNLNRALFDEILSNGKRLA